MMMTMMHLLSTKDSFVVAAVAAVVEALYLFSISHEEETMTALLGVTVALQSEAAIQRAPQVNRTAQQVEGHKAPLIRKRSVRLPAACLGSDGELCREGCSFRLDS